MSEKMYALLLRLYPSRFRKAYGDEALQLFRDRARDEGGFRNGLRLWLDLLGDLAVSVPRAYRSLPAAVVVSSAQHFGDGMPSFHILEDEALGFGSLLYGGIVSLVVYGSILFVLSHGRSHVGYWAVEHIPRYSATAAKETPTVSLSYLTPHPGTRSTVSLTAIVSATGTGPTPTGSVIFFDGHTVLNTVMLQDGTITVIRKVSHTTTHAFKAIYCGDTNYSSASSTAERE